MIQQKHNFLESQIISALQSSSQINTKIPRKKSSKRNKQKQKNASIIPDNQNLSNQKYIQIKKKIQGKNIQTKEIAQKEYFVKLCQICLCFNNQDKLILCDSCDDGYHFYCLEPPLHQLPTQQWICPQCIKDQELIKDENPNNNNNNLNCLKCQLPITKGKFVYYTNIEQNSIPFQVQQQYQQTGYSCMHCNRRFHTYCLNQRVNAVNCSQCQRNIRKRCPKGYDQFYQYIVKSINFSQQLKKQYQVLQIKKQFKYKTTIKRLNPMGLQVPKPITDIYSIIKQEATLYYALQSQHMSFIDDQVYQKSICSVKDNNPQLQGNILSLAQKDEQIFKQFKRLSNLGYYGPIQINQDKQRGFYARSIEFIPGFTILAEYVGQVMNAREVVKYSKNNSIYSLLRTARSKTSLDICPMKFGNISKFLCGINNKMKNWYHLQNVKTLRFNYQNKVRILFYAKRNIQAGQILSINYNGGGFQEYPTQNFI